MIMTTQQAIEKAHHLQKVAKKLEDISMRLLSDPEIKIMEYAVTLTDPKEVADILRAMPSGLARAEIRAWYKRLTGVLASEESLDAMKNEQA
jgi:hypothetical protein